MPLLTSEMHTVKINQLKNSIMKNTIDFIPVEDYELGDLGDMS